MDFEGLLLRKVSLQDGVVLAVINVCIEAMKRCFPEKCEELVSDDNIRKLVHKQVTLGVEANNVFENPLRKGQLIVFARLWSVPCWFVLGDEEDGVRRVITVRIHKDRSFGDEYKEVEDAT